MSENYNYKQQDTGPPPVDQWEDQIFTLKDAYAPREPLSYLVEGLFHRGTFQSFMGSPASLKSMLMGDIICAVASGTSWLGREVIQGAAIWVDFDNGARRTHERFEALARGRGLPETTPLFYYSLPSPWLDAGQLLHIEALERRIKALGATLVVIDNKMVILERKFR